MDDCNNKARSDASMAESEVRVHSRRLDYTSGRFAVAVEGGAGRNLQDAVRTDGCCRITQTDPWDQT